LAAEITADLVSELDRSDLYGALLSWPEMLGEAKPELLGDVGPFRRVRFVGFGGSRVACELLARYLAPGDVEVYGDERSLARSDERFLLAVVSASGMTKEALYLFLRALRRGLPVVAITSGGGLLEACERRGLPCLRIPFRHSPRASFPYLLAGCLSLLHRIGRIEEPGALLAEIAGRWARVRRRNALPKGATGPSARLARYLKGGLPLCHYSEALEPVAQRFAKSLAENAKVPCLLLPVPEAMHNYICGLERIEDARPLWLGAKGMGLEKGPREAARSFYAKRGLELFQLAIGPSLPEAAEAIYELELATLYLALLLGVDPTPVQAIEEYKAALRL
jgi:glucose/mannose-6-phosphate isomerase